MTSADFHPERGIEATALAAFFRRAPRSHAALDELFGCLFSQELVDLVASAPHAMLYKVSTFRQRQVTVESERGAVFLINFLEFCPQRYWAEVFMLLFHIVMAIVSGLLSMAWIAIIIYLVKKLGTQLLGIARGVLVALVTNPPAKPGERRLAWREDR
jgi:hypothetical protein